MIFNHYKIVRAGFRTPITCTLFSRRSSSTLGWRAGVFIERKRAGLVLVLAAAVAGACN